MLVNQQPQLSTIEIDDGGSMMKTKIINLDLIPNLSSESS